MHEQPRFGGYDVPTRWAMVTCAPRFVVVLADLVARVAGAGAEDYEDLDSGVASIGGVDVLTVVVDGSFMKENRPGKAGILGSPA